MTKKTRVSLIAILIAVAIALALGAVSSWYRNWNASTWFNYWGKGAPTTTATVDNRQAHAQKSAANAGLVYDSEDGVATVDVKQVNNCKVFLDDTLYSAPSSVHQKTKFYVEVPDYTIGNTGSHIKVTDWNIAGYKSVVTLKNYTTSEVLHTFEFVHSAANYVDTPQQGYTGYRYEISFDEISEYIPTSGFVLLSFVSQNFSNGEHLDSGVTTYNVFFNKDEIQTTRDGTTVSFSYPGVTEYGSFCAFNTEIANSDYSLNYYESNDNSTSYGYKHFLQNSPAFVSNGDIISVDLKDLMCSNELGEYQITAYFSPDTTKYKGFVSAINGVRFLFEVSQLPAPTNIRMENLTLKWDVVDGAAGYAVFFGDAAAVTVTEPTYALKNADIKAGTYNVRVRALGNIGAQLAATASLGRLTPYNASYSITQLVVLNYSVEGDVITKLVPYGSTAGDYLYDVEIPNKEFGGWFYDSGYSVKVNATDMLDKDMTVYARLSDVKVTERPLTWWERYKWYVLGPAIGLAVAGAIVGVIVSIKKHKA